MRSVALKSNNSHSHCEGTARDWPILVALGANLPGKARASALETCCRALGLMHDRGINVVARSQWYASAPVPAADQPDFVNSVAVVKSALQPMDLLIALHGIEDALGRVRTHRNAARVIDLDLIVHGDVCCGDHYGTSQGLVLPHPRLHERAFVLLPIAELFPDWCHPATGSTVGSLIAALPPGQRCTPIA